MTVPPLGGEPVPPPAPTPASYGGYPPPPPPVYGAPAPSPYGPPQYVAPPRKQRPRAWWFLPGVVCIALAIGGVVIGVLTGIRLFETDGYVVADGLPHTIALDDGDYELFSQTGLQEPPQCTTRGSSEPVSLTEVNNDSTVSINGLDWVPFAKISTVDQDVAITCDGVNERIRVGSPVDGSAIVTLAVSIIAAVVLGLVGLAALVVTTVLWFTRAPRTVSS
jgi:hypothetical protein